MDSAISSSSSSSSTPATPALVHPHPQSGNSFFSPPTAAAAAGSISLNRDDSTSSEDSNNSTSTSEDDETDGLPTPPCPSTMTDNNSKPTAALSFNRAGAGRAHFRTVEMLQFEGRDNNPSQVWICNGKPRSPLPGYVPTPMAESDESAQTSSYFATHTNPAEQQLHAQAGNGSIITSSSESEQQHYEDEHEHTECCLRLGHRPKFIHSETVPDLHQTLHHHHHQHDLPIQAVKSSHPLHHHDLHANQPYNSPSFSKNDLPSVTITPDTLQQKERTPQSLHHELQ